MTFNSVIVLTFSRETMLMISSLIHSFFPPVELISNFIPENLFAPWMGTPRIDPSLSEELIRRNNVWLTPRTSRIVLFKLSYILSFLLSRIILPLSSRIVSSLSSRIASFLLVSSLNYRVSGTIPVVTCLTIRNLDGPSRDSSVPRVSPSHIII